MMLRPTVEQTETAGSIVRQYQQPSLLQAEPALDPRLTLHVKYEFLNPVRSFKIRGALTLVHQLAAQGRVKRLVTCSTGNHGSAMAYACQQYGLALTVGVPVNCNPAKVKLMQQFGADIEFVGADFDETKAVVEKRPYSHDTLYTVDGSSPEIVAGTSTIAWELLEQLPDVDVFIVPVGNGALIGGIGAYLKAHKPATKLIGVQAEGAPCMALSFAAGKAVDTDECNTFAGGMAVRVSIPEAVTLMCDVVDEVVLVSDEELKMAMGLYYQHADYLPEGAGAGSLAAARKLSAILDGQTVCLLATGGNVEQDIWQKVKASL
ncbi:MAG: pyridoxal-phosphate dependent enzyme [Chloroflexota bacterium]